MLQDQVAIVVMRFKIGRLKIRNYDRLVQTVQGLRRALDTQKRVLDDMHQQLAEREAQIKKLQAEYASLQEQRSQAEASSVAAERLDVFKRVQAVAVQLPTLRAAVDDGASVTAQDVLDLLAPFEQMLRDFGFEVIGEAGGQARYEPTRHRLVGRGARSVTVDDMVRVRYVGYLHEGQVVCKAEVVRVEQPEMVAEA
jgi:ABC-type transporter Mla subunit MlaD